jgi:hypothetical protein
MQLDKLVLDLRPRTNMQALDLGFALLGIAPLQVYLAWLALWLPLMLVLTVCACIWPEHNGWYLLLAWWLRPLLERAPLYVLSRAVFGENVPWHEAVRAWPGQLAGGSLYMLLLRPLMAGRSLRQAIWQLEGARGKVASERYRLISRNNAGSSANWFGIACAHFEAVLQFGTLALIGIFVHQGDLVNPFLLLQIIFKEANALPAILLSYAVFTLAAGVIGPIYSACGFTLYLNRRATLEAWDIEIVLRQIKPPGNRVPLGKSGSALRSVLSALLLGPLLALTMGTLLPAPAQAAAASSSAASKPVPGKCPAPDFIEDPRETQGPDQDTEQGTIRLQLRNIYAQDDLRNHRCEEHWQPKDQSEKNETKKKERPKDVPPWLKLLDGSAGLLKIVLIVAALCLVVWFIYRFRDSFTSFLPKRNTPKQAQEVGGLDIRPESLPDDIIATVQKLWHQQEQRAALGLLYRATLSRLVSQNELHLSFGATEADCLREARSAHLVQRLGPLRWQMTRTITDIWLQAAYGQRWPDTDKVMAACKQWRQAFDMPETETHGATPGMAAGGVA